MQFIRKRVLAGEVMLGVGANLGSSLTVEMIGKSTPTRARTDFRTSSGNRALPAKSPPY